MSFWLPAGSLPSASQVDNAGGGGGGASAAGGKGRVFHENDYYEIVREVAGDLVETVSLVRRVLSSPPRPQADLIIITPQIDEFTHPKTNRQSRCYRLNYRHMDRSLSNEEVNALQEEVQKRVVEEMGIEMR